MSDKSKIYAIGEKKLIGGTWYEKAELEGGSYACAGCAFVHMRIDCDARQNTAVEDGGYECIDSIWITCDPPQPETPAVEECAGCRYWKDCGDIGDCHRSGPVYIEGVTFGQWPTTKRGDWCGEWKA